MNQKKLINHSPISGNGIYINSVKLLLVLNTSEAHNLALKTNRNSTMAVTCWLCKRKACGSISKCPICSPFEKKIFHFHE